TQSARFVGFSTRFSVVLEPMSSRDLLSTDRPDLPVGQQN
ncbi:MAG: hypothetical protein ACI9JD_004580, partial [Rhodococcus sp. (in: high G+C Gram-positive bacteria)]